MESNGGGRQSGRRFPVALLPLSGSAHLSHDQENELQPIRMTVLQQLSKRANAVSGATAQVGGGGERVGPLLFILSSLFVLKTMR